MQGHRALLAALLCRDGVDRMRAEAQAGLAGLSPTSRWRAAALLLEGLSYLLVEEGDEADRILARAVEVGTRDAPPPPRSPWPSAA
jgi:hypothetical protein